MIQYEELIDFIILSREGHKGTFGRDVTKIPGFMDAINLQGIPFCYYSNDEGWQFGYDYFN